MVEALFSADSCHPMDSEAPQNAASERTHMDQRHVVGEQTSGDESMPELMEVLRQLSLHNHQLSSQQQQQQRLDTSRNLKEEIKTAVLSILRDDPTYAPRCDLSSPEVNIRAERLRDALIAKILANPSSTPSLRGLVEEVFHANGENTIVNSASVCLPTPAREVFSAAWTGKTETEDSNTASDQPLTCVELAQGGGNGADAAESSSDATNPASRRKKVVSPSVLRQQKRRRLFILQHGATCELGPACTKQLCPKAKALWEHVRTCKNSARCKREHCLSSKRVLLHLRQCQRSGQSEQCEICKGVMQFF